MSGLVQQELWKQRGGKREGAGRKKNPAAKYVPHRERANVTKHKPVHAGLRVVKSVGRLRRGKLMAAIETAALAVYERTGFRLVHFSIQSNHLHFLVEADSKDQLSRGMQALAVSAAAAINRVMERTGKVFQYRYSSKIITNPRQARSSLAYVLNNWRRHCEDEGVLASREAVLDPYSSATSFSGWSRDTADLPSWYVRFTVSEPQSWLLREGWKQAGGLIDPWSTPGPEWSPTVIAEKRASRNAKARMSRAMRN